LKAVAATFPDAAATMLPNSADANSAIGGLTLIPEVPGKTEMPTASKKNIKSLAVLWFNLIVIGYQLVHVYLTLPLMIPVSFHARWPVVTC
jgi:hypothetical protein